MLEYRLIYGRTDIKTEFCAVRNWGARVILVTMSNLKICDAHHTSFLITEAVCFLVTWLHFVVSLL